MRVCSHKSVCGNDLRDVVASLCGTVQLKRILGSGGIRTHAPEETGALIQRLRPLGHATHENMQKTRDRSLHELLVTQQIYLRLVTQFTLAIAGQ